MPIICQSRKVRYILDMDLARMRTGCGRNKAYAIMQSIATIDWTIKNSLYARRVYKEFSFIQSSVYWKLLSGQCLSGSSGKGRELLSYTCLGLRYSVPVLICRTVPYGRLWRSPVEVAPGLSERTFRRMPERGNGLFIRFLGRESNTISYYSLILQLNM